MLRCTLKDYTCCLLLLLLLQVMCIVSRAGDEPKLPVAMEPIVPSVKHLVRAYEEKLKPTTLATPLKAGPMRPTGLKLSRSVKERVMDYEKLMQSAAAV